MSEEEDAQTAPAVAAHPTRMALRLVALAVAFVLAVAIALVVVIFSGPPSVDELRTDAGLDGKRTLKIGVKFDQPGIAERQSDGRFTGFDIDIAHMIAEDLGYRRDEVEFFKIESEDRERMQGQTPDGTGVVVVDLVIASFSITPEREDTLGVTFSAPYLYTEQSAITLKGHQPVATLEDLAGKQVCSLATATSATAAARAGAQVVSKLTITECLDALRAGQVDAISTDAAILGGLKARYPDELLHWDIGLTTTEAYGINVGENDALLRLVNLTLHHSREDPDDDRWEDAFDANIRVSIEANRGVPLARPDQPKVDRPDVREWPWERAG